MKPRTHTITINGDVWTYKVLPRESYDQIHPDVVGSVACTNKQKHQMAFVSEHVSRRVVIHELIHSYCKYLYLDSSDIRIRDHEEILAEMMEEKLDLIGKQATQMYKKMHQSKKSKK